MVTISRELIGQVLALPARHMWTDYDAEADVLYISFANHSKQTIALWKTMETSITIIMMNGSGSQF